MKTLLPLAEQHEAVCQESCAHEVKEFSHQPVLSQEVVQFLNPRSGEVFLDGTLGGGGHSLLLLEAGARVFGCDRDLEALSYACDRLSSFGDQFVGFQSNYTTAGEQLKKRGIEKVDGILLDLGVSSYQLDTPERGFSFMREGPLDMRMGLAPRTAAEIVNTAEQEELISIFRTYGEEPRAVSFAKRIVQARAKKPIKTTTDLAEIIEAGGRFGPRHPATRIFQALRIAVNQELEGLETALPPLSQLLAPQGRLGIISFHSLEDRIVKRFFKKHSAATIDDPTWPAARANPDQLFRLLTSRSITATEGELRDNPRARSARLRVVERISQTATPA